MTASALIALLGSVLTLGVATLVFTAGGTMDASVLGGMMLARLSAAFLVLCAAAGIATAIGLLRLLDWARIAILVFAGVLIAFSALSTLMVLALPIAGMTAPDPEMIAAVRPMLLGLYAATFSVGVWWLVLFTKGPARNAFAEGGPITPSALPLDLALIAWGSILAGIACFIPPFLGTPAFLAGMVLTGWAAALFYVVVAGIQLYMGWGLLRRDGRARRVAIAFFALATLHGMLGLVVPGMQRGVRDYARDLSATLDPTFPAEMDAIWWWASALLVVGLAVTVWLLARREATAAAP